MTRSPYNLLTITIFLSIIGSCTIQSTSDSRFYAADELHTHVFKFKDCNDKFIHKHAGKNGKGLAEKKHAHLLADGCQWQIDQRQKSKSNIYKMQQKLKNEGLYSGSINGELNAEKKEAFDQFRKKNNKLEDRS